MSSPTPEDRGWGNILMAICCIVILLTIVGFIWHVTS